jgi:hypothetical protein
MDGEGVAGVLIVRSRAGVAHFWALAVRIMQTPIFGNHYCGQTIKGGCKLIYRASLVLSILLPYVLWFIAFTAAISSSVGMLTIMR